jgi:hypothetical protein
MANDNGAPIERRSVDLSGYPDLVVIYLGMRPRSLRGFNAMGKLRKHIKASVDAQPDGLLLHEDLFWSVIPFHGGMRQYWRDFDALERWSRSLPHSEWWKNFLRDPQGTGFWHETYFIGGGFEAIYDNVSKPIGMLAFAPAEVARGRMFGARSRAGRTGEAEAPALSETELYG